MVDHLTYQRRNEWPIIINRKRGPSDALNENWKDNRFGRHERDKFVCLEDCCYRVPGSRRGSWPPPEDLAGEGFNAGVIDSGDSLGGDPYKRFNLENPPPPLVAKYEKYDLLEPTTQPDELALLLCPQYVYGYCLREKSME